MRVRWVFVHKEMPSATTRFLSTLQERPNLLRDLECAAAAYQIDDIRQAMLRCLEPPITARFPHVERSILMASSLPALWFMRPELLMALATHCGEQVAHNIVDDISAMFDGLLPEGLNSRPGPQRR
jgi:hypothetical protein